MATEIHAAGSVTRRLPRPSGTVLLGTLGVIIVCGLIGLPLVAMLGKAVAGNGGWSALVRPMGDFIYWQALGNTIVISGGAAALATLLGTVLAWLFVRTDIFGGRVMEQICQVPIFIPAFVGAVAWVLLAAPRIGILNRIMVWLGLDIRFDIYTPTGMLWVMGIYLAPYVMMIVAAALRSMDPSLEEAAQISGLNKSQTALKVTAPLLAPAIASGAGISFAIALGLFGTPMVLGWSRQVYVLTSRIWMASQTVPQSYDLMATLSIYLLVLSSLAVFVQNRLLKGRQYFTVTGKGFRPRPLELTRWGRWLGGGFAQLYLLLTVVGPIAVLTVAAISSYTWSGQMSAQNLWARLATGDVVQAIRNSLVLSVSASTLGVGLAILFSWILVRSRVPGRGALEYLLLLPISVPGITFGVGVLLFWIAVPLPVYGTSLIIVFAFVGRFMAYAVRSITASLGQIHPELEESARIFGYRPLRTFLAITAPLILPSIITSWLLMFSFCMTELSMVILLYTSNTRTISILVFELWGTGDFSHLAAISLLQVVIGLVFMAIFKLYSSRTSLGH